MFDNSSLFLSKVNIILSALFQPFLLTMTWPDWLNTLILFSVNMALFQHILSYSSGIMAISLTFETRRGSHTAVRFELIVVSYGYVFVLTRHIVN